MRQRFWEVSNSAIQMLKNDMVNLRKHLPHIIDVMDYNISLSC